MHVSFSNVVCKFNSRPQRFDELVAAAELGEPRFRDSGTYAFYRLAHAEILYGRSSWIAGVRERISSLPDSFWQSLGDAQRALASFQLDPKTPDIEYLWAPESRFLREHPDFPALLQQLNLTKMAPQA